MRFPLRMLISTIAVMVTAYVLPGITLDSFLTAFATALLIGLLNTIIKPVLIIISIQVTLITFGLFLLVINSSVILIASGMLRGFHVNGLWNALFFSIILSGLTVVMESMISSDYKHHS
ncbi:MAG: phage holin family protein [Bacteroidota bacterium]